jgi:hypothetical protein
MAEIHLWLHHFSASFAISASLTLTALSLFSVCWSVRGETEEERKKEKEKKEAYYLISSGCCCKRAADDTHCQADFTSKTMELENFINYKVI